LSKLLLSLVLVIMIVAVSYIQAVRRQEKVDNSFQLGKKVSQQEILKLESRADSLRTQLGNLNVVYGDSLLAIDKSRQRSADSLAELISTQEKSITELKKKVGAKPAVSKKSDNASKRHLELLACYKKRYESLPSDLTEYERKAAVSELRQETASKYSISLVEFNRIRNSYKVTY